MVSAVLNRSDGGGPRPARLDDRDADRAWWRQPTGLLVLIAVAHGVAPLVLLGPHWGLGIDESVYLSQLNAHVPAGLFSAPRARGTTLLAAPVTLLTSSIPLVRSWLAALSAVGLFLAYQPWLRVRSGYTVPIAALLFTSLWSVTYYGFEAMPNEWVAYALLAATGHTVAYLRDARARHLGWIVLAMTLAALLRPSDAGFATGGLVIACVVVMAPRRLRVRAGWAALAGTVLGAAQWVIEAYASFGGVGARIHAAQAEQGGGGLRFSGLAQARALAGPLLCRAGCHADAATIFWLWWVVGAGLILVAIWFGRHRFRQGPDLVVLLVALACAAQYVLTVSYAAPRFLIPVYGLMALPCASAIVGLCAPARRDSANNAGSNRARFTRARSTRARARARRAGARSGPARVVLIGAIVAALLAHVAIQADVLLVHVKPAGVRFNRQLQADAGALHALGVRRPCVVLGQPSWNEALAYASGCRNVPLGAASVRHLRTVGSAVVWLGPTAPPVRYGPGWRRVLLPGRGTSTRTGTRTAMTQVAYLSRGTGLG